MANTNNIILVTIDSLRSDFLSICDEKLANLEKLANESFIFKNVYASAPATKGAFASLFTSTYPSMYGGKISIDEKRLTLAELFEGAGWNTYGFHSNPHLSELFNYNKGFKFFYDDLSKVEKVSNRRMLLVNKLKRVYKMQAYMLADKLNKKVFDTLNLEEMKKGKNFVWIHYMDVHGPYYGRMRKIPLAKLFYEVRWRKAIKSRVNRRRTEKLKADYMYELKYLDAYIGNLLDYLRKNNIYDQSTIVFLADHGDGFGEHGFYSHPQKLYNELIKIPLMIKFPKGFKKEIDTNKLIGTIDITPSLLSLSGIDAPEQLLGMDFISDNCNEYVFSEADIGKDTGEKMLSLVNSKWKYIFDTKTKIEELYNLVSDANESRNLAGDYPEIRMQMKHKLDEYRKILTFDSSESYTQQEENNDSEIQERLKTLGYM